MLDLNKEILKGVEQAMRDTRMEAGRRSAGDYSTADLAAMDHPFARRHGSPQLDPTIINDQTGTFRDAWETRHPTLSASGGIEARLVNESDRADWLKHGNRHTFPRDIEGELERYASEEVERRVKGAIDKFGSQTIRI